MGEKFKVLNGKISYETSFSFEILIVRSSTNRVRYVLIETKFDNNLVTRRPKTQNLLPSFRLSNWLSPTDGHCVQNAHLFQ